MKKDLDKKASQPSARCAYVQINLQQTKVDQGQIWCQ